MGKDEKDFMAVRRTYSDGDLYRLFVARQLLDGYAATKEDVDAEVRKLGDIEAANELIEFRNRRPGCIASDYTTRFQCACGVSWTSDDANPPACQQNRLR